MVLRLVSIAQCSPLGQVSSRFKVHKSEDQAKVQGIKVKEGLFPWIASGRAITNVRDEVVTKLLFDDSPEEGLDGHVGWCYHTYPWRAGHRCGMTAMRMSVRVLRQNKRLPTMRSISASIGD